MREVTPALIDELTGLVSRAAAAILAARAGALAPRSKTDGSPVTAADEAAEAVILDGLERVLPGVPVVSEEAGAPPDLTGDAFVLVDPLDGTRELLAGSDEFCINLAVVRDSRAQIGIMSSPTAALVWRTAAGGGAERLRLVPGAPAGTAAECRRIAPRPWPATGALAAVSRSHLDAQTKAFLAKLSRVTPVATGSALKLCRVAQGEADVYPRLSPVNQWDVAAGDAIVTAAGGIVTTPAGAPLAYGAGTFLMPGFIAWGDPAAPEWLGFPNLRAKA